MLSTLGCDYTSTYDGPISFYEGTMYVAAILKSFDFHILCKDVRVPITVIHVTGICCH